LGSLGDIPGQIESFVEHKVIDYLENKILAPIEDVTKVATDVKVPSENTDVHTQYANEAAAALTNGFNAAEEDVVHGLLEAGYVSLSIFSNI
jgi:hypothetical protein